MRSLRALALAAAASGALVWAGAGRRRQPVRRARPGRRLAGRAPRGGAFQLTLAGQNRVSQHLSWGGRVGLLVLADPGQLGVPLDARLRGHFGAIYVEGLVGPWLIFRDADPLRFHAAIGFGLVTHHVNVGAEVGLLDGGSMVGLRLAFPL